MELPNILAAGIFDSRIAQKNIKISKNRKTTMFEIELPMEKGGVSYIDADSMPITADMVISVKPNQIRHTKFPFKCYYVHMIVPEGPLYDALINSPVSFYTDQYEAYRNLFIRIIQLYDSLSQREEILLQSLILELIYNIARDSAGQRTNGRSKGSNRVIDNAIRYVAEHLTEELSLNAVAQAMSMSPVYFHKLFKASVGKTLHDYVEELRIRKAISLLQATNDSLAKIAYESGFSSQSYFSYVFKRRMKQTPREYVQDQYNKYEL